MQDVLLTVAGLMELSARTAPKCLGQDFVRARVIAGETLRALAEAMERYGQEKGAANFDRDAASVRQSAALLLIALAESRPLGLNCGACGQKKCADLSPGEGPEFKGPLCAWRVLDLGIAIGSAVKTAALHNVDNRVMYRPGVVARRMGLLEGELVVAIPLSATGKNIYFDRPEKK